MSEPMSEPIPYTDPQPGDVVEMFPHEEWHVTARRWYEFPPYRSSGGVNIDIYRDGTDRNWTAFYLEDWTKLCREYRPRVVKEANRE